MLSAASLIVWPSVSDPPVPDSVINPLLPVAFVINADAAPSLAALVMISLVPSPSNTMGVVGAATVAN